MLVTRRKLAEVAESLSKSSVFGFDTEGTGLRPYHGDVPFSAIIADEHASYYFNCQSYPDLDDDWVIPWSDFARYLCPAVFDRTDATLFIHHAKYDMAMTAVRGIEIKAKVYCTAVLGRLLYNRHLSYELAERVREIGEEKSTEVDDYIKEHGLFTWIKSPGKEKREKQPHFDRVPFPIISRYGEKDGTLVRKLGIWQMEELRKVSEVIPGGKLLKLVELEAELTKVCFGMERIGIKIDRDYCERAYRYELGLSESAKAEFTALVGMPFVDSGKSLAKAFDKMGETYPRTEKGNPSFTADVLEGYTTPLAKIVSTARRHAKRANTYYANFLYFADGADKIHANIRQGGTDTGRFSYSDPNLQNVPVRGDDGSAFPVRRAFIPDDPDWILVGIDYDQMEYRLLLDYAGETEIIRQILQEKLDVHAATAKTMGVDRDKAKTLNFQILYGGGDGKLAASLGVPLAKAKDLRQSYFQNLPRVRAFSRDVMERAEVRGFIFNWAGRVLHFPRLMDPRTGKLSRFAYKGPNHIIQGGCADIVKLAMLRCTNYLAPYSSRLVLQVHDELVFKVRRTEARTVVPELQRIMATAYPHRHLPLTCSVEWSAKSWGDMEPWESFA